MDSSGNIWSTFDLSGMFKTFAETSTAAMAITDTKGIITWCNARFIDANESTKDELVGTPIKDYIIYPDGMNFKDRIQHVIDHGYNDSITATSVTKAGNKKYVRMRTYRLDDNQGNHVGYWSIAYELTAERMAVHESKAAVRVITEMRDEEIKEKQMQVIDMLKVQGNILCPGIKQHGTYCPAILAVEESLVKDQDSLRELLTDTELKIARYAKKAMSIKQIANELCISERTVKNHRHSIRKKLNITNTSISLIKYLQNYPL